MTPQTLQASLDALKAEMHVAFPATVVSYDATERTVDVRPGLVRTFYDEAGEKQTEELPVIPSVRVARFRCGGFFIDAPLAAGDGVLVICCDRDPSAWSGDPVDPGDEGLHGLQGAVAIPGLAVSERENPAGLTMGAESGAVIEITSGTVKLGATDASEAVALASKVAANFSALVQAITAATAPSGGGALVWVPPTFESQAATLVNAK